MGRRGDMNQYRFERCEKFSNKTCDMMDEILREFTLAEGDAAYSPIPDGRFEEVLHRCNECTEYVGWPSPSITYDE